VTSSLPDGKAAWGGRRKLPYAFTEYGVLMLSSVLKSKRAIAVEPLGCIPQRINQLLKFRYIVLVLYIC
jgi:hypothetical protein